MSRIELKGQHLRYFTNPCVENPATTANIASHVTEDWLKETVKNLSRRLISRQVSVEECQAGGPYTGVGGIGYALLRVARLNGFSQQDLINSCNDLLEYQMAYSRDVSRSRYSRYLTGTTGLLTIRGISDSMAGKSIDQVISKFKKLVDVVVEPGYQPSGDDEILNGRAGFLAGVLTLRIETGQEILTQNEIRRVLEAMLTSGRNYSRSHKLKIPLMYQWHNKEYLGAAHGLSGILQMFLCYWGYLTNAERQDVLQTLNWFLTIQSPEGNFPSSSGSSNGENELIHWCHGASGAIHMLICAYIITKQDAFLQSAKRCAALIWERGLLRKGPGICHGVAGSGYAFLLLYRITSEEEYLSKAKVFAMIAMNPGFLDNANTPDDPYSLFEGLAGTLCYLTDMLEPMRAQFPMVPIAFG
ncbi:lanthionine synthetase c-like protein domain-containing protein [Ditylenchus destructor]|uniref:Lanthionine synthetase c-like protein domain-containing protein n=1 Tax=Ditylenchus destructor TaxID=166010 RepID=A0AAD4N8T6_9BILA|nr:lanthionine synthetase c-like protein domain-containing protein [Ditylenchus destructor]